MRTVWPAISAEPSFRRVTRVLLAQGGRYAELFELQAAGYR